MARLPFALLLIVGCGTSPLPGGDDGGGGDAAVGDGAGGGPVDGGADGCPASQPQGGQCKELGLTCSYAQTRCKCGSGWWYCVDADCPLEEYPTGACARVGTRCPYGFEHFCSCTSNGWLCCGGLP